jgi:pimeloyl-ACP methyl ester carboxylesterase
MFKYKGIKINYKDFGNKEGTPIIYLHGWGQNIAMMEPIAKPLEKTHRLIILDLPGFGLSDEPEEAWDLDEFVEMLKELLKKLKIDKPNLIGHSFGGKISLLYASKYEVNKLILLASPYKVKIKKPSMKVKLLKKLATLPGLGNLAEKMKKHLGSTDYKNASPLMREILVKHVNTDLTEAASKITCPTFIIWGTNDEAVPVEDAYELEKIIKDSGLSIYEGCTHYAYLERLGQTNAIIKTFIK